MQNVAECYFAALSPVLAMPQTTGTRNSRSRFSKMVFREARNLLSQSQKCPAAKVSRALYLLNAPVVHGHRDTTSSTTIIVSYLSHLIICSGSL